MRSCFFLVLALLGVALTGCQYGRSGLICDFAGAMPLLLPSNGQKDVPLNTWIWGPTTAPILTDSTGKPIALSQVFLQGLIHAYAPSAPFDSGMTYSFTSDGGKTNTTFTVGQATLTSPPALPLVSGPSYWTVHSVCRGVPPLYVASFGLSFSGALAVPDFAQKASEPNTFPILNWDFTNAVTQADGTSRGSLNVGNWGDWPTAGPGSQTDVRFGVYDLAGNFSGWTSTVHVTMPTQ